MPRRLVSGDDPRLHQELGVVGLVQREGQVQPRCVGFRVQRQRPIARALVTVLQLGLAALAIARLLQQGVRGGSSRWAKDAGQNETGAVRATQDV
jgi:hypothetical protein